MRNISEERSREKSIFTFNAQYLLSQARAVYEIRWKKYFTDR